MTIQEMIERLESHNDSYEDIFARMCRDLTEEDGDLTVRQLLERAIENDDEDDNEYLSERDFLNAFRKHVKFVQELADFNVMIRAVRSNTCPFGGCDTCKFRSNNDGLPQEDCAPTECLFYELRTSDRFREEFTKASNFYQSMDICTTQRDRVEPKMVKIIEEVRDALRNRETAGETGE